MLYAVKLLDVLEGYVMETELLTVGRCQALFCQGSWSDWCGVDGSHNYKVMIMLRNSMIRGNA